MLLLKGRKSQVAGVEAAPPEQTANVVLKAEGCSAIDSRAAALILLRLMLTLKL
jgi:hypothetical protein